MRLIFAEYELDTERELLSGPAGPVSLRRQTYRMLLHLAERAPALVTRDELMDELWGHHALSPNVVPQTISELRQALGDDAQQPRFIETRHRRGYVFVAPVQRLDTAPVDAAPLAVPAPAVDAADAAASDGARWGEHSAVPADPPTEPVASGLGVPATANANVRFIWLGLAVLAALLLSLGLWLRSNPAAQSLASEAGIVSTDLHSVVLDIVADADHAELAALLRSSLRQAGLVVLAADSPARAAPGLSLWQLQLLPDSAGWRLRSPDPAAPVWQGGWSSAQWSSRHSALLQELAQRWPLQLHELDWPEQPEAVMHLARGLHAAETEQLAQASSELRQALGTGPSRMTRFALARVLARSGEWRQASEVLASMAPVATRSAPAELLIEALRAELAGQPGEAMAALRAYLHLVPLDVDSGLLLLQWQLRQRQWDSAQSTLDELQRRAGWSVADSPLLLWRARLLAGRGQTDAALEAAQAGLAEAQSGTDRMAVQQALRTQAELLQRASRLPAAAQLLEQVDASVAPDLALLRGSIARERGELDEAQAILQQAAEAYGVRGRWGDQRRARLELAIIELRRGQQASAREQLLQLHQAAMEAGEPRLSGDLHAALGLAHAALGDAEAARSSLELAVDAANRTADPLRIAGTQLNLGVMLMQQQRRDAAQDAFLRAAEGFRSIGESRGEATAMANLGAIAARDGRHAQAREAYAVALERQRQHGATAEVGRIAFNLGLSARAEGDLVGAAQHFAEALEALQAAAAVDFVLQTAATWSELELLRGQPQLATEILARVAAQVEQGSALRQAAIAQAQARLHELAGQSSAAREQLIRARELRVQAKSEAWVKATDLRLLRLEMLENKDLPRLHVRIEQLATEFSRLGEARDALLAQLLHIEAWQLEGDCASAQSSASAVREAIQQLADRSLQLQLDWLVSQCAAGSERDERLRALERAADAQGYALLVHMARRARLGTAEPARTKLHEDLRSKGLSGALQTPSAAF